MRESFESKKIKVTLVRSLSGRNYKHKRIFASLGLKKIGGSNILPNVNSILGQVNKVIQFIKVEKA